MENYDGRIGGYRRSQQNALSMVACGQKNKELLVSFHSEKNNISSFAARRINVLMCTGTFCFFL